MKDKNVNGFQKTFLIILRLIIGWHFLYEGVAKLLMPNWSSATYLQHANWLFANFFQSIVANEAWLKLVDLLNIGGLIFIGLGLILGVLTRVAASAGVLLLALYYITNPPFIATGLGVPAEGHYLFINKNLIEMVALIIVFIFPTGNYLGIDRLLLLSREIKRKSKEKHETLADEQIQRRELIKNLVGFPVLAGLGFGAYKKTQWERVNALTGASITVSDSQLKDLQGELPMGEIAGKKISRLILGGNLIGGWSHSRDLIYVSSLFKAYNTDKKVFETLELAEKAGVNTMNITHTQFGLINKYKRVTGGQLQTICQIHPTVDDPLSHVDKVIDAGVDIIQIQGNCCDWRVKEGRIDVLEQTMEYARKQGYPIGIGAHSVQALIATKEYGLKPDFYMKTLHHDQYWSAHPRENRIPFSVDGEKSLDHNQFHDNIFCLFPEESVEFIQGLDVPVIGFKVLAGGAIHPKDGFKFAFESGADFICVGMFDFQIVDDVNITTDTLANLQNRSRRWFS